MTGFWFRRIARSVPGKDVGNRRLGTLDRRMIRSVTSARGNVRANGDRNPDFESTFVFPNDFAALLADRGPSPGDQNELFHTEPARGTCRVICFSPRHDLTLARMPLPAIRHVVDTWAAETESLGETWRWVQVFENKGDATSCPFLSATAALGHYQEIHGRLRITR